MELKYIWIKEFNSIEQLGVNFSHTGKHRFSLEGQSLKLLPNRKPILEFGDSIFSITAIAGKNGAGKSSLCEIILHAMATLTQGSMGYKILFEGIVCFDNYIFHHEKIEIRNKKSLKKSGYVVIKYKKTPLESFLSKPGHDLQQLGFIYYSNVIDWRSALDENNLSNISTQSQIYTDVFYGPHYPYHSQDGGNYSNQYHGRAKTDLMTAYFYEEAFRQTNFYVNFANFIPFKEPSNLRIFLTYSGNNKWLSLEKFDFNQRSQIEQFERTIFDNLFSKYPLDPIVDNKDVKIDAVLIKKAANWLYRYNLVISYSKEKSRLPDSASVASFVFDQTSPLEIFGDQSSTVTQLIQAMSLVIERSEVIEEFNPYYLSYRMQGDWRISILQSLTIPNFSENRELVKQIIDLENVLLNYEYRSIKRLNNYFTVPRSSAGEFSFMSLFARIYQAIKWNELGHYDRKYFVLFIDEGEINFHPAWKRKVIKWLVEYLNLSIHRYKFQVIITTHSPYLLSDLSHENVILLDIENGKTKVVENTSYRTFGANIHELLADSFFLHDGFIGEYAREKIESLVGFLTNEGDFDNWDKRRAENIIETVADEIIKQRLQDLFRVKFGEPVDSLRQEISSLETKLKKLREQL